MLRRIPVLSLSAPPETLFLGICLIAGTLLSCLKYEERDGGLVPTAIFRDRVVGFRTFVVALLFTSAASAGSIMHRSVFPGYSRLCRGAAGASLLVASTSLVLCSVWWGLIMFAASLVALHGGFNYAG
ncbi:hypothetical protein KSP39_PZI023616 [Platanthera zijinensis]|uniref:Uncharacterized protein n=1 Tax=Platanthera zijinensis TaxID=2320716 RepID=A0AAP0ATQ1_9ASPA